MKDPLFLRRKDSLSTSEAAYWKDALHRSIKIGAELEVAPPKGCDRPTFEAAIRQSLEPSGSFDSLGVNGVLDVSPEHCGIEIRTIGRPPHFWALRNQYAAIMKLLLESGARPRPTCGLHFHLLTPGLAESVPEIVLANLWNLTRRYAPELRYLTSTGENRVGLCRRRQHHSYLEMIRHTPYSETMEQIQQSLRESSLVPEHQNFLNLQHVVFDEEGMVRRFHLEFRFPDADICPISVAAKTCLFLAMALKSVDLAQYGLMHVGKLLPWKRKLELLHLLCNNDGDLATSDTHAVTDEVLDELRLGSHELLDLLEPAFEYFHGTAAGEALRALADHPISLMCCDGYGWSQMEQLLASNITERQLPTDRVEQRLMESIEIGAWNGLPSAQDWCSYAAFELYITRQELDQHLDKLQLWRGLRWNEAQGTIIFNS